MTETFRAVKPLNTNAISARILDFAGEPGKVDLYQSALDSYIRLTVADARILVAWLQRALPREQPCEHKGTRNRTYNRTWDCIRDICNDCGETLP